VLLWLTRDPAAFPGWSSLLGEAGEGVSDATVSFAVATAFLCTPLRRPDFSALVAAPLRWCRSRGGGRGGSRWRPLGGAASASSIDDDSAEVSHISCAQQPAANYILDVTCLRAFPIDVVLVFGGGFALSAAFQASGLSATIGGAIPDSLPTLPLMLLVTIVASAMTNVASNVATASILLPLLASIAEKRGTPPMVLLGPGTMACTLAFLLPISTPPNMIVFSAARGGITVGTMFRRGLGLTAVGVVLATTAGLLLASTVFARSSQD
jgi:uncharacterized membrane protein YbaN (DUF454 family)